MFSKSNMDYCLTDVTSEVVNEDLQKYKFQDVFARNMFNRSNMDFCIADVTSERVNEFVLKMFLNEYCF